MKKKAVTKKKQPAKKDNLKPVRGGILGRGLKRRMGRAADITKGIRRR